MSNNLGIRKKSNQPFSGYHGDDRAQHEKEFDIPAIHKECKIPLPLKKQTTSL